MLMSKNVNNDVSKDSPINLSLSAGTVPCRWKRVRVSALFKAGDMNEVIN